MLNLASLASNIHKQSRPISNTIVGVVTDVTRPLFRPKQNNWIVMVKVIDESLNDLKVYGVMSKDCTVYLISKNKSQLQFIKSVGQIVVLDKFTFSLWNDIKLETKYLHTTQGIYTVSVDISTNKLVIRDKMTVNIDLLDITNSMTERVKLLMEWRSSNLAKVYEPKLGISILNSHCVMVEPFNMILRFDYKVMDQLSVVDSENQKNKTQTIILKDLSNNVYRIKCSGCDHLEQGDIVFIRGIASIGQALQLTLTETGNILRFAYKVDPNLMNYMAIYRDNQKFQISATQQNQGVINQFTVIQCQHNDTAYLQNLLELEDRYNHSNNKSQIDIRDAYFVNAVVINYEGSLSMYHREYQILLHEEFYSGLSQEEKREYKDYNRIGYVYEGVLGIIDRSNETKGKLFYVHLFTCDAMGNFIGVQEFQKAEKAIGTPDQQKTRADLLHLINSKLNKLVTKSSFSRVVPLVLEPIRSERLLFRVANTKFI